MQKMQGDSRRNGHSQFECGSSNGGTPISDQYALPKEG